MAKAIQKLFSIVLMGRHNPQILNHDFLVKYSVLPETEPFFRELKEGEDAFTEFFSTPPISRIAYGEYSFLVQENRYQAADATGSDPIKSPIIEITKHYFGKLLKYTPLTLAGLNLHCNLSFENSDEEEAVLTALGIDYSRAKNAFQTQQLSPALTATFPFCAGNLSVGILKPKNPENPVRINFNYEYKFSADIDTFLSNLDGTGELVEYQRSFYERVGITR